MKNKHRKNKHQSGFTIIELLVSISIIALLVSMIMPALKNVREKARSILCRTHLRQWHLAMDCYANENNNYIPRRGQGVKQISKIDRPEDWFNALPEYIGFKSYCQRAVDNDLPVIDSKRGQDLFICPSAKFDDSKYFMPLAMNMYLSPWIRPVPHRVTEISQPAMLVFMAGCTGAVFGKRCQARIHTMLRTGITDLLILLCWMDMLEVFRE